MTFFAELLNDNSTTKVLLVGVGNIGRALDFSDTDWQFTVRANMVFVNFDVVWAVHWLVYRDQLFGLGMDRGH